MLKVRPKGGGHSDLEVCKYELGKDELVAEDRRMRRRKRRGKALLQCRGDGRDGLPGAQRMCVNFLSSRRVPLFLSFPFASPCFMHIVGLCLFIRADKCAEPVGIGADASQALDFR
jgi:hypothetical protein